MDEKLRVVFFGTPDFAVPSLLALAQSGHELTAAVTQPDRPKGRGRLLSPPPVKAAAEKLGIRVYQPERIKEDSFLKQLDKLAPDLIVVVAFGQILPKRLLALPRLGCINVHASLLPFYRGAAPIHWAVLNGEKETGITTMLMDTGLDTGAMLLAEKITIPPDMTTGELHDVLAIMGAELLVKTVGLWRRGDIRPRSQQGLATSYAPLLKREHELIDWSRSAETVHNQIRGLQPWPGAFTFFEGKPLKISAARLNADEENGSAGTTAAEQAFPGTVLEIQKGRGFIVQTGQGSIRVCSVLPQGKKIMSADSFVNGYHLEVGYVFGAG